MSGWNWYLFYGFMLVGFAVVYMIKVPGHQASRLARLVVYAAAAGGVLLILEGISHRS